MNYGWRRYLDWVGAIYDSTPLFRDSVYSRYRKPGILDILFAKAEVVLVTCKSIHAA